MNKEESFYINKEECPVCKNNKYFTCDVSSINGIAHLTNALIGRITLNICTKCGCVYVSKRDLDLCNRTKNRIKNTYEKYFKR